MTLHLHWPFFFLSINANLLRPLSMDDTATLILPRKVHEIFDSDPRTPHG